MITVKIPAAIRVCSPVYMETPHGNMVTGIAARLQPENGTICVFASDEDIWNAPAALVSLIISDPTGAAHLAWWLLYSVRWTMTEHVERIEAMGWTLAGYQAAVDCAARGLSADLARLADYAHRVAGVTNG